ncbi:MAG: tetratricopeptide repeat protein [Desulfomonile tiedjei]|uniref:Tetratricopeptide repeat protein n=1 Tax=Desulfomonile tiedjei TaxID=2358 RepID=A0A9D6UYD5_9BACT|nr:tetratricopeptide repeat protein [Desulfomonile tiedjei]
MESYERMMEQDSELTNEILALAAQPDHKIELAQAALTIARLEYPNLDVSAYLERLDGLAAKLKSRIGETATAEREIDEMNRLLFQEEGFRGNSSGYYDPRNSFLNQVLDRKLGIPITLSIVYIGVGRRAGLPLYGIGFPGHFLTGLLKDKGRIVIDTFNKGRILSEDDCRTMFQIQYGGTHTFTQRFLDPAWPRQILVRLLRNLKSIYWRQSQEAMALQTIEWILILDPISALEVKQRGLIREATGDIHGAITDLQKYLTLTGSADDRETVEDKIEQLKKTEVMVH